MDAIYCGCFVFMSRFFTLLLLLVAAHSLLAIDKKSNTAAHKGDVFKLGDLLAKTGDARLQKELANFKIKQNQVAQAAVKLKMAIIGIQKNPLFAPENQVPINKKNLMVGVDESKALKLAMSKYLEALNDYEKFVNQVFNDLKPPLKMPTDMSDGFLKCRKWASDSEVLSENNRVFFEFLMNGTIPVQSSLAKNLVKHLGDKVRLKKEEEIAQGKHDRELEKLKKATAEVIKFKPNYDKAKAVYDKVVANREPQEQYHEALGNLIEKKNFLYLAYTQFELAENALKKATAALDAATQVSMDADKAVKSAEAKAKEVDDDATKPKEEKEAALMEVANKKAAAKSAKDGLQKAKDAEVVAKNDVAKKTKTVEDEKKTVETAETRVEAVAPEVIKKADEKAGAPAAPNLGGEPKEKPKEKSSDKKPPASSEKKDKLVEKEAETKTLAYKAERRETARSLKEVEKKKEEAVRLLEAANAAVAKAKPSFDEASKKWMDLNTKKEAQKKEADDMRFKVGQLESSLRAVERRIVNVRIAAKDNCQLSLDELRREVSKHKPPELNNVPVPFVRDR